MYSFWKGELEIMDIKEMEGYLKEIESIKKHKEKLIVKKNKLLTIFQKLEFGIAENKIIDLYAAILNYRKSDDRVVIIRKKDLEELLGVTRCLNDKLEEKFSHLKENVCIRSSLSTNVALRVNLFDKADIVNIKGEVIVKLISSEKAMELLFKSLCNPYVSYPLMEALRYKGNYSYIMFQYLQENKRKGSWEIELDELKTLLNCDKEEYYKEFKNLNREILKKTQLEINGGEFINYDYDLVKSGRTVKRVKFTVNSHKKESIIPVENEKSLYGKIEESKITPKKDIFEEIKNRFSEKYTDAAMNNRIIFYNWADELAKIVNDIKNNIDN